VALLHFLKRLQKKYSLKLYAAWLDHGLQTRRETEKCRRIVEAHCRALEIPLITKAVSVKASAKKYKLSLEEAGREERYRFFSQVAAKQRAQKIATAHTLDDQAETILLRMIRGAGPKGLAGIPAKRPHGRHTIIRPLIECEKKDILGFLKDAKLPYWTDPSNRNTRFTRNRVRHVLLPLLEKQFNPNIKRTLARQSVLLTPLPNRAIIHKH
jgi:tRNA(Ile)-lysidine synthase